MVTRREWLRTSAGAGAALVLDPSLLDALRTQEPITRPIPSSGEHIPVIGLGGRWISRDATADELSAHRAVLRALADGAPASGRVFDTAAGYGGGASEEYSGGWAEEDGLAERIFWATRSTAPSSACAFP